jgi:hypothetical protein
MRLLIVVGAAVFLSACNGSKSETFTLYRASTLDPMMRIHMATFDAAESGPTYNQENCQIAADLFSTHPGVTVRYWCEKGLFRP